MGPSGSGKSTIIKLMTGEVVPTAGRVMVNGFSMSRIAEKQIPYMRRTIGVIFQDFRLIGNKTVRDNLALAMRAVGASPRELKNRIPYVLELVGLADKENSYPDQLSGGEQQRVAIARALAQEPKLLVFDEPTGNLDVANEQRILRQARRLARTRGMTVLCTLHDLNQAMAYGDRLFLMRDGQVRYAGNGDILTPETVWDIFGARVRAAEIDGQKILIGVNEDDY